MKSLRVVNCSIKRIALNDNKTSSSDFTFLNRGRAPCLSRRQCVSVSNAASTAFESGLIVLNASWECFRVYLRLPTCDQIADGRTWRVEKPLS